MDNIFNIYNGFILLFTLICYIINEKIFKRILNKHNNLTNNFLFNFFRFFIVFIGVFVFLFQYEDFEKILNILLTNSALLVAVLGFALQNSIKNLIAGLMLISSDAFKVGDRVRLPDNKITGTIEEINLRHIIVKLVTNERAIIPNSVMNDAIVINNDIKEQITSYPIAIHLNINKDVELAKKLIEEAIEENNNIINKENTIVTISHLTTNDIELKSLIWSPDLNSSFTEISKLKIEIVKKFQKHNLY